MRGEKSMGRFLIADVDESRIEPWVFHRNGRADARIERSWEIACAAAGCEGKLFHDLRRTAFRNFERTGVPRSIATKITGHRTEAVYRRYAIVNEGDVAEGLSRLAGWMDRVMTESSA
jgi:hypothetical protein